jgi:hypothetical protein
MPVSSPAKYSVEPEPDDCQDEHQNADYGEQNRVQRLIFPPETIHTLIMPCAEKNTTGYI